MIESPLLQKLIAENLHDAIHEVLKARFGAVQRDVTRLPREILNEGRAGPVHRSADHPAGRGGKGEGLHALGANVLLRRG